MKFLKIFYENTTEEAIDLVITFFLKIFEISIAYKFAWKAKTKVFLLKIKNIIKYKVHIKYLGYLDFVCQILELGPISLILKLTFFLIDLSEVIRDIFENLLLRLLITKKKFFSTPPPSTDGIKINKFFLLIILCIYELFIVICIIIKSKIIKF